MALSTAATIKLSEVIIEIGLPTASGLNACFTNANASGFNPTYEGSKDRLSNFRGYQHVVLTAFSMTTSIYHISIVCDQTTDTTRYHDGAGTYPVVNDTIYIDSEGITPLTTNGWYKISDLAPASAINVNSSGVVVATQIC